MAFPELDRRKFVVQELVLEIPFGIFVNFCGSCILLQVADAGYYKHVLYPTHRTHSYTCHVRLYISWCRCRGVQKDFHFTTSTPQLSMKIKFYVNSAKRVIQLFKFKL